jgi:hypothetical protein
VCNDGSGQGAGKAIWLHDGGDEVFVKSVEITMANLEMIFTGHQLLSDSEKRAARVVLQFIATNARPLLDQSAHAELLRSFRDKLSHETELGEASSQRMERVLTDQLAQLSSQRSEGRLELQSALVLATAVLRELDPQNKILPGLASLNLDGLYPGLSD